MKFNQTQRKLDQKFKTFTRRLHIRMEKKDNDYSQTYQPDGEIINKKHLKLNNTYQILTECRVRRS